MCVKKGPPSIWLTINPADTQDPIAQLFCGQFLARDHHPSGAAIAADPYAAALFFHVIIYAVLENLLGIKGYTPTHPLQRHKGILGNVKAYIGTVEAQGRGTLHLHMLLWLSGSLTMSKMDSRLQHDDFRNKIQQYIDTNIHADLACAKGCDVLSVGREPNPAFSRPIHPQQPNYEAESKDFEDRVARTVQVHQCGQACMKLRNSQMVCKCKAPFKLADEAWINDRGDWGPRRTYPYLNNWNPSILQCVHANHNIKLITNGKDTKDIAWYVSDYSTKGTKKSSNISTLLAKMFIYHRQDSEQNSELTRINKRLIQQCGKTSS